MCIRDSTTTDAIYALFNYKGKEYIASIKTIEGLYARAVSYTHLDVYKRQGKDEIIRPNPTRLDFLNESITRSVQSRIGSRFDQYRNDIEGLISKYPNTKIAQDAKKGV